MVDVRDIKKHEKPPENTDHVLIEKIGTRFVANGSVAGKNDATFFTPRPFDTLAAALAAAKAWAEMNDIPVIYVRGT